MTITRAITTVSSIAVGCATVGAMIGYCLGRLTPSAYRGVFPHGDRADFDPVEVGIGLGLAQGLLVGAIVGLVIIALVTWYEIRAFGQKDADRHEDA